MMEIKTLINGKTRVVLDQGAEKTSIAILLLPGASGGAFSDKYKALVDQCLARGFDFLRVQSWNDIEELEQKNIREIQEDIDQAIEFLKASGYTKLFAIGKSFGGGVLLTHVRSEINKMVLWAPAIGATDNSGNLDIKKDIALSKINSLLEITIDKDLLSSIKIPVKIIQGTDDDIVPMENSLKLASFLPFSEVVKIDNMGHTAKTQEEERELINNTINFFD